MTRHRASWPRSPPIAIVSWPDAPAWPSPGSWVIASALQHAGLDIATAVGQGVAIEFAAYAA